MAYSTWPRQRATALDGIVRGRDGWTNREELLQDAQLWLDDGDCVVHLHSPHSAQRQGSLRLSFADIEALQSSHLIEECLHIRSMANGREFEIFVPAPPGLMGEEASRYDLVTRNCFAFASRRPLVGNSLGSALVDIWIRLQQWGPRVEMKAKFLSYCEEQGYSRLAENADHALACLQLAEYARMRELWIDAFAHCVGMQDRLAFSPEFAGVSPDSQFLILKSSLQMNRRVQLAIDSLGSFLEEELGPEAVGLSKPARDHLDRFRSCIHNYYVDKLGYFPPDKSTPFNKRLWTKMYQSFRALYSYLVDGESNTDPASTRGLNGGICIAQNVQAFDQRHEFAPLPHPLCLLPESPLVRRKTMEPPKALRSFKLSRSQSSLQPKAIAIQSLERATNSQDDEVMACALVQEYQQFERQKTEEKLSTAEARKIRWLLIYGILQMLVSILRAPAEVKSPRMTSYPLCIDTADCPEWSDEEPNWTEELAATEEKRELEPAMDEVEDRISIHPDCEADCAEDYFANLGGLSRKTSAMSLNKMSRAPSQISRTASIRSSVQFSVNALQKSVAGSLGRRATRRRSNMPTRPSLLTKSASFCEIVVEGYGNGSSGQHDNEGLRSPTFSEPYQRRTVSNPMLEFDFGLHDVNEEPSMVAEDTLDRSASDSSLSAMSSNSSDSEPSSAGHDDYNTPATELSSSWVDDCFARYTEGTIDENRPTLDQKHGASVIRRLHSSIAMSSSVNVGCYTPTGYSRPPPSTRFSRSRCMSVGSIQSAASSQYDDSFGQAAEIEEVQMRGRRRLRGLDIVSEADMLAEGRAIG